MPEILADDLVAAGGPPPRRWWSPGRGPRARRSHRAGRSAAEPVPGTTLSGTDAPAAATVARTAAALQRKALAAGAAAVVGIAGVGATTTTVVVESAADDELHAVGVTTVGRLVRLDPYTRWSAGGAAVRFTAGREPHLEHVDLGLSVDDYEQGQTVTVLYDPASPDRMTIDDVPYSPEWTLWPGRLSLLAALAGGPLGVTLTALHRRARRLLRAHAWTPIRVSVVTGHGMVVTTPDAAIWQSSLRGDWPAPEGEPHDAWWVSDGRHAVFSPDRGRPLVVARLRSEGPLRRLARPPEPHGGAGTGGT